MPSIEPVYIAVLIAAVIGVVWYFQHKKNQKDTKAGIDLVEKIKKGDNPEGGLLDAVSGDEEDVPKLKPEDADPQAMAEVPVEPPAQVQEEAPAVYEPPAYAEEPVHAPIVQRRKPELDAAVEAVINITPLEDSFNLPNLKQRIADVQAEPLLMSLVRVQCFDAVSGVWYEGADRVTKCTQIYLSMLLANRTRCVDEATVSKFMIHAEQFAIELKGESQGPDSNVVIESAQRIKRIVEAFDKRLSVKLVAAKDITEDVLESAAVACGFVKTAERYERSVAGVKSPVFSILPPQTLGNEIELSFAVPLMAPAADPLGQFFEIANDLCCRIDATMTDASGNPIGARAASRIAAALKTMHNTMAEHGVPAGSRRACLIFSAD